MLAGLCLTVVPAHAVKAVSRQPGPTAADEACRDYATVMISRTEKEYAEGLPYWKFRCEHNPNTVVCIDTSDSIETMRNLPPLKCGQPASALPSAAAAKIRTPPTPPPVTEEVAKADNACADYAAAYISKTEKDYASKLGDWRDLCEHHPVRLTCQDTQDTVQAMRRDSAPPALKCGQR